MKLRDHVKILRDGDDTFLLFSDELMDELGWNEGDCVEFTSDDNSITIEKVPKAFYSDVEVTEEEEEEFQRLAKKL